MDALERTLLFDYYGELLTQRQRLCFDMRFNQDLSLGEIAEELGITRQGVHDNLNRAEQLLRNMEEKTGCLRRWSASRKARSEILAAVERLEDYPDETVAVLAKRIRRAAEELGE